MNSLDKRRRKARLHEQQHGRCHYCSDPVTLDDGTLDHVVPRSRGGPNAQHNLVLACTVCNRAKGDMAPAAFYDWLERMALRHKGM